MIFEVIHRFLTQYPLIVLFSVVAVGLGLGHVRFKGIHLGSSGVLFTALLAGHLGYSVPSGVGKIGLVLFVYCVGLTAGDRFFATFLREGVPLALLAVLIVSLGAATCWIGARLLGLPAELATGIFAGALTSTPALAAAGEAAGAGADAVGIGYGIAYPFGVVGVVLFVQVLPRMLQIDLDAYDDALGKTTAPVPDVGTPTHLPSLAIGLALGAILGLIPFGPVKLGLAGGPLLVALVLGHFKTIGFIHAAIPQPTRLVLQELGLVFFLAAAGMRGGGAMVDTLKEQGASLFLLGIGVSVLPLVVAWPVATKLLKMNPLQALGGICGGMTSTPALGAITSKTDSQAPVVSYVAAYPVALLFMILTSKLLVGFM